MKIVLRNTVSDDFDEIRKLQRRIYTNIDPWELESLESHIKVFPEGQFVVEADGKIVGTASSLVILWEEYDPYHTWFEITGNGRFTTHNPEGKTLYGAEICVDPNIRNKGIGGMIYKARRELCRKLNLKRIIAAGRLPNYHLYSGRLTPREYAMHVLWGDIYDPVLRFQIDQGFQFCDIVDNYLPGDKESLEFATLIVWLNRKYKPD